MLVGIIVLMFCGNCVMAYDPGICNMFGMDAKHTGRSPFSTSGSGTLKWTYSTPTLSSIYSKQPSIAPDGTIYFGCSDCYVYAVNPDGSLKWRFLTNSNVIATPAIGPDGTIYVVSVGATTGGVPGTLSAPGMLYAINPDGTQKWSPYSLGTITYSSPTLGYDSSDNLTIYVGTFHGWLVAITSSGSLKWQVQVNNCTQQTCPFGHGVTTPAVGDDGTIYVGVGDIAGTSIYGPIHGGYNVAAVDSTGAVKWHGYYSPASHMTKAGTRIWPLGNICSPSIASDGTIYAAGPLFYALNPVASEDTTIYSNGIPTGSNTNTYWSCAYGGLATAIGASGTIYASDGEIYTLNPQNGAEEQFLGGDATWGCPIILSRDGAVYEGSTSSCYGSSAAIGPDGTYYKGCADGKLYACGPAPKNVLLAGMTPTGTIMTTSDMSTFQSVSGTVNNIVVGNFCDFDVFDFAGLTSSGNVKYYSGSPTNVWYDLYDGNQPTPPQFSSLISGKFVAGQTADTIAGLSLSGQVWYWNFAVGSSGDNYWVNIPGTFSTLVAGDFNGDGKDELAGLTSGGTVEYTTDMATWTAMSGTYTSLASGDFNGDGKADLAATASDGTTWYTTDMLNWVQIPGTYSNLASGYFQNIGHDCLFGLDSSGTVGYTSDFQNWTSIPGHTFTNIVVSDFDRDGVADVAGLAADGSVWYTTNRSSWVQIPGTLASLCVPRR